MLQNEVGGDYTTLSSWMRSLCFWHCVICLWKGTSAAIPFNGPNERNLVKVLSKLKPESVWFLIKAKLCLSKVRTESLSSRFIFLINTKERRYLPARAACPDLTIQLNQLQKSEVFEIESCVWNFRNSLYENYVEEKDFHLPGWRYVVFIHRGIIGPKESIKGNNSVLKRFTLLTRGIYHEPPTQKKIQTNLIDSLITS